MVSISVKARIKDDGTLDLHVPTGLPETDVEVLLVVQPLQGEVGGVKGAAKRTWPEGYFETTFGSLRDNPIAYEPPPHYELREELR